MKNLRPPIVTVLGHVDHGKTTLLDAIRSTKIASREAGGITQSIGASVIATPDGKEMTFIDTPGHAAFTGMRERGAKVADIAILVVAADDGVMPQTKEAITFINEAAIPFIVAITKTDLPNANVEVAKASLEKEGVYLEGRGGDTPVALVSARKGEGIKELLELINLVSEVNEIEGSKDNPLEAVVVETSKGKSGPVVSAVVRDGTLRVGDEIDSDGMRTKVRGIFDDNGKSVKTVEPGRPALILGFSDLPGVGSKIVSTKGLNGQSQTKTNLADSATRADEGKLPVLLKVDSQGALEATINQLKGKVNLVSTGIGDVTESDIFLAKAAGALVLVFGAGVPGSTKRLAETESVIIENYRIIYELLDSVEEKLELAKDVILGRAEIVQEFPLGGENQSTKESGKRVAGSRIVDGIVNKKDKLTLMRGEKKLGEVKVISMKRGKGEVAMAQKGEEFGLYFEPQFDFKLHDVLLSVRKSK